MSLIRFSACLCWSILMSLWAVGCADTSSPDTSSEDSQLDSMFYSDIRFPDVDEDLDTGEPTDDIEDTTDDVETSDSGDEDGPTNDGYDNEAGPIDCADDDLDSVCNEDDLCDGGDDRFDSDADGVPNACDICETSDDEDADGTPDECDPCPLDNPDDTDHDGVCDSHDQCESGDDRTDTDLDGVPDACDVCPDGDDLSDDDSDGVPNDCDCDLSDACHEYAYCAGFADGGSPICICLDGFEGDGTETCGDVNECEENPCATGATCTNTLGGYVCDCGTGFTDAYGESCQDIDECLVISCPTLSSCHNTAGSYECSCVDGAVENSGGDCVDINECAAGGHDCDTVAGCIDGLAPPLSWTCGACPGGYEGGGTVSDPCNDINECDVGGHDCDPIAGCIDGLSPPARWTCDTCPGGYEGGGTVSDPCDDINECVVGGHDCDVAAGCADGLSPAGSWTCGSCGPGYLDVHSDGTECRPELVISFGGNGGGVVSDEDLGLECGGGSDACSGHFARSTEIVLTAQAMAGSEFLGWSGVTCGASDPPGTCTTNMSEPVSVVANFNIVNNLVFVTEGTVGQGTLGAGGDPLVAADLHCANSASSAGLTGTYRAWLSTSTTDARDRLQLGGVTANGWIRLDGLPFAESRASLLEGHIYYPVVFNQHAMPAPSYPMPMTGTRSDGTYESGYDHCDDYSNPSGSQTSGGNHYGGTNGWTNTWGGGCGSSNPLYCFGVDVNNPVTFTPADGLTAFVTEGTFSPAFGADGSVADSHCQTEAMNATPSLEGTFMALIATDTQSAGERLFGLRVDGTVDYPDDIWVRTDGIPLVATSEDYFTDGDLLAALTISASGDPIYRWRVWTGINGSLADGGAGLTCNNWSSTSGTYDAETGIPGRTLRPGFVDWSERDCGNSMGLYCLEVPE